MEERIPRLSDQLAEKNGSEKTAAFFRYMRRAAFQKNIPLSGTFELTPRCSLDCRMCYVHLNKAQMYREELETGEWLTLIDEACEAGMMEAKLTGGECLLYPGFRQIYERLQENGVLVTVLTNGTLMDREMVGWLAERTPQRIQISVYGSSPEGYKNVTGSAEAFYRVDQAIDLIKEAGIPLDLAITVSKQLVRDFGAILKYCKAKNPLECRVAVLPFEPRKETGRAYRSFLPSLDEQIGILKAWAKTEGKTFNSFSCEEELLNSRDGRDGAETGIRGIGCAAGRIGFSIKWDGKMTPCNALDTPRAEPLRYGFQKAWESINRWSREYAAPPECSACSYRRACLPCPAVHLSEAGPGKINPLVCEITRRLALEGIREL